MALAATLLLPVLQIFSGIFMVMLVLKQGVRLAITEGVIALGLLSLVYLLSGLPVLQVASLALLTWAPAVLLAATLQVTRSLTLTMQVSALVAVVAVLGFHLVVDDLLVFWEPTISFVLEWLRSSDLREQVQVIESNPTQMAHAMTIASVVGGWTMSVVYLLFGYRYSIATPEETGKFGRFCDLNFGRVIAFAMAVASLLAFATGMVWLQSVAIVLFAVFWLQGLAVIHWMFVDGELPLFVVIMTYLLLPFLQVFLVIALAVVGFTDAWFRYRRRVVVRNEK